MVVVFPCTHWRLSFGLSGFQVRDYTSFEEDRLACRRRPTRREITPLVTHHRRDTHVGEEHLRNPLLSSADDSELVGAAEERPGGPVAIAGHSRDGPVGARDHDGRWRGRRGGLPRGCGEVDGNELGA